MAYGILVDVHGPEDWSLSTEQIIGNVGEYYISDDDQLHFKGGGKVCKICG